MALAINALVIGTLIAICVAITGACGLVRGLKPAIKACVYGLKPLVTKEPNEWAEMHLVSILRQHGIGVIDHVQLLNAASIGLECRHHLGGKHGFDIKDVAVHRVVDDQCHQRGRMHACTYTRISAGTYTLTHT